MKRGRERGDEKGRVGESLREWDSGDGGRTDMRAYILSVSSEMDNILLKASKKREREKKLFISCSASGKMFPDLQCFILQLYAE